METAQSTTSYSYDTGNKTLLTGFNSSVITYDELNQPITFKGNTLSWSFGKLIQYGNNTYDYSMVGKRIKKSTSNQNIFFIYDGDRLIREDRYDQYGNHSRINYIYGNKEVIGFRYESNGVYIDYYYRKNMFGDVVALYYNSNGHITTEALYYYDAWGNCIVADANETVNTSSTFIGNINPIRYRSYYYDVETQLFYCNSRYYSPELCRWISPDSIEYLDPQSINGLNLYAYCGNDPVNRFDPSGHFAISLLFALALGTIAFVSSTALSFSSVSLGILSLVGDSMIKTLNSAITPLIGTIMGIVSDVPTTFITLSISTIASVIPASIFEGLSIMFKEAFQSNSSTINGNELKIILEEGPSLITNSSMKAGLSFGGYNSKGGALGLSHKSGHLDEADEWWTYPY